MYFSNHTLYVPNVGRVVQSVQRLATGWTIRGSNPGGGEIFLTCPDPPCCPPSLLYNGHRVFPECKERPGRDAVPSPLLVPCSRKSRAIPLLPLWAVRPVQSLSACTRVHFTFTLPYTFRIDKLLTIIRQHTVYTAYCIYQASALTSRWHDQSGAGFMLCSNISTTYNQLVNVDA